MKRAAITIMTIATMAALTACGNKANTISAESASTADSAIEDTGSGSGIEEEKVDVEHVEAEDISEKDMNQNHDSEEGKEHGVTAQNTSDNTKEESGDYPLCVRVGGVTYQDTGYISSAVGCGNMDGEIVFTVDGSEMPAKNEQSNFGTGYEYKLGGEGIVLVRMNDQSQQLEIFRDINSADTSIPAQVASFIGHVEEINGQTVLLKYVGMPDGALCLPPEGGNPCEYIASSEAISGDVQTGDNVLVWYTGAIAETDPAQIDAYEIKEYVDNTAKAQIDYGSSALYSEEDMESAILAIKKEFRGWEGCELHSIRYGSDDCNSQENIKWMNELNGNQEPLFNQCIEFISDFHSPVNADQDTSWNPDEEYTDWQWWLARFEGGGWQMMTWGY